MIHDFGAIIFSWLFLILLVVLAFVLFRYMRTDKKKKADVHKDAV